jgi:drug/metabolite transporter (DMT)-like permease
MSLGKRDALAEGTRYGGSRPAANILIGLGAGLAAASIWALWSVATRYAVVTSLGPHDVTFLRFGVSSLFLWPVLAFRSQKLVGVPMRAVLMMIIGAGVPFMYIASSGLRFAPASHIGTLMIGAMPLFVAIFSAAIYGEKFNRIQTVGFAAVLLGVVFIGGEAVLFQRTVGEWRGDVLFLAAGALFAGYTIAQRRSGISPWHAAALVNVSSTAMYLPIYFFFMEPKIFVAPMSEVLFQAVAQGIGVALLGLLSYGVAVQRLGASRAAIFGALTPGLATLLGIPALGEYPTLATVAGIVLVTTGVFLVSVAPTLIAWMRG